MFAREENSPRVECGTGAVSYHAVSQSKQAWAPNTGALNFVCFSLLLLCNFIWVYSHLAYSQDKQLVGFCCPPWSVMPFPCLLYPKQLPCILLDPGAPPPWLSPQGIPLFSVTLLLPPACEHWGQGFLIHCNVPAPEWALAPGVTRPLLLTRPELYLGKWGHWELQLLPWSLNLGLGQSDLWGRRARTANHLQGSQAGVQVAESESLPSIPSPCLVLPAKVTSQPWICPITAQHGHPVTNHCLRQMFST